MVMVSTDSVETERLPGPNVALSAPVVVSVIVPLHLLLHAPWVTIQALLPAPDEPDGMTARNLGLQSVVLLGEFLVTPLPEALARTYLCGPATASPAGTEYFGVVLQFRRPGGGTLGLLWTREASQWKLVSYQPLDQ